MSTPHNEAEKIDISDVVLMPGDPLRAKYIAEKYLINCKIINNLRNMISYTGYYKDRKITVFPSGMGMPSMGIYAYEFFNFYDVKNIIRIGTCGAFSESLNIFDTLLVENSYTEGNFAKSFDGNDFHISKSSDFLNKNILDSSFENNIPIIKCNIACSEVFDYYIKDFDEYISRFPKDLDIKGSEMESFSLFYLANYFNRNASCILSVVDSRFKEKVATPQERQNSLNNMIFIALETCTKI